MLCENWFFCLFIFFYALYLFTEIGLDILNIRYINKHKNKIPSLFEGIYSIEDYKKSIAYTMAKTNFKIFGLIASTLLVFAFIFTNFFGWFNELLKESLSDNDTLLRLSYPFSIGAIFYLFSLPQSYYFQFVLEERFGFNRMSKKTFLLDNIKSLFLSLLFGLPLLYALFYIIDKAGDNWWIYGFILIMAFQLFTAAIYPVFLAPLFNKFTPLSDGSLKDRILELAKKINFRMAGIFTIDGSKRSSHSNAFFAGIGSMRRIVLFDTLVEKHSEDEIIGVIAHEMGHNAKKHVQKSLLFSSIFTFLSFYILAACLKWPLFFTALGAYEPSMHVGLVLFALFSSVFMFPITPLFTALSRKHEFEADEFSVHITKEKEHLANALVKLTKENLGNLTPHPLYSFYHYSHPTTIERVNAIKSLNLTRQG